MNITYRLLSSLYLLFGLIILKPIFWLMSFKKAQKVPEIEDALLLTSACDLARKIRRKEVSSEAVIKTYIKRIKEVNPIINAVSDERFEAALREAKEIDLSIATNYISEDILSRTKPFLGVPVTIKESCGLKGLSQAVGSLRRLGIKCDQDSVTVERLKESGFIPLLVTNCPEYCVGLETNNLITGITNNPYDTKFSAGGSSGGEASLIAAAGSLVGIGSDFAGSIRLPCLFNGIFGHKTTPRFTPRKGHFPDCEEPVSDDYFSIGPMTRHAKDLKPLLKIIAGPEGCILKLDDKVDLKTIKVFYSEDTYNLFGLPPIGKEIIEVINQAKMYLKAKHNVQIKRVNFKGLEESMEISTSMFMDLKGCPNFLEDPEDPKKSLPLSIEFIKCIIGKSQLSIFLLIFIFLHRWNGFIRKTQFGHYFKKLKKLQKQFIETLGDSGVFLYPTFPTSAFQHYEVFTDSLGISNSMIFNLLGCPSTQVPTGLDKNKMPIGFQIVAAPNQDRLCLAVAEEMETCFGGWIPPQQRLDVY